MGTFIVREDESMVAATVASCWKDAWTGMGIQQLDWHLVLQLEAGDTHLTTVSGVNNAFDMIECRVTPILPYRDDPWASDLLGQLQGARVKVCGSWGDFTDDAGSTRTVLRPIAWITVETLAPIVEEHGFTQVLRDLTVFAFSDDSGLVGGDGVPPHHQEDRHFNISVKFPHKPQSAATPVVSECIDREDTERMLYFARTTPRPRFPLNRTRTYTRTISQVNGADVLTITIDTGTPTVGQGFLFQKLTLTYDEPFEEMCLPNVCLDEPGRNCQATGEYRHTWRWPRIDSALAGDLLLGPAGGEGVIGKLLGALSGPQFYDHMVMFVENDGQSVRHCTASDDRVQSPAYFSHSVKVKTPFGSVEERLPLAGIRGDVLKFAWPGSITQSLGEVCITGRNRFNPMFGYTMHYPKVAAAEAASPPLLRELDPAERSKRTAFHDPEATQRGIAASDADQRAYYSQVRLQRAPSWRPEIDQATGAPRGWIHPVLVKPHPMLDSRVREALAVVAGKAKKISAHYRFFAYSKSAIGTDPTFTAPPESGWAAGTLAAQCSSFVWTAVQAANDQLSAQGRPTIELEGETEGSDRRSTAGVDGLYRYTEQERLDAAQALWESTYARVTAQVQQKVDDLSGLAGAIIDVVPGVSPIVDDIKDGLGQVVANQLCNVFAFDTTDDLASTWNAPGEGAAASPDDTMLRWDVNAPANVPPPSPGGRVNVYGTSTQVKIAKGGWVLEPIIRVVESIGFGEISGIVVRREFPGDPLQRVPGATVRFGCLVSMTDIEAHFAFENVKAGTYELQASTFVVDKSSGVAVEWKSEPRALELPDGESLTGLELELLPPAGVASDVMIRSHHDIVDRVVVGKDRWGHFDLDPTISLMWDPRDDPNVVPEEDQRNTVLSGKTLVVTPAVGSGVHVSVAVTAALRQTGAPGSVPFDGSVIVDTILTFYDTSEGQTNAVVKDPSRVLAVGEVFNLPYNIVSDDTVPERASGFVQISNISTVLP